MNTPNFYYHNIDVLSKANPLLFQKIQEIDSLNNVQILCTKDDLPTVKIINPDGKSIFLHSAYYPIKEAKDFVSNYNLKDVSVVIVLGFGAGYHIEELISNYPWIHTVIVIEPNIKLFKKILECRNLDKILNSSRSFLFVGNESKNIISSVMNDMGRILTGKVIIMPHQPSINLLPIEFNDMKKSLLDGIHTMGLSLTTTITHSNKLQTNIIENIPAIINSAGIVNLFGKFAGKPAICVGSGPSLEKNIELLNEAKGKALIIACDSVVRVLLERNIVPDMAVTIDFSDSNYNKLNGVYDKTKDIYLVFDPETYSHVVRDFQGGKFCFSILKSLNLWINEFITDKGSLVKGMCVGHCAFEAARQLGCTPIILIGQDLSYTETSHIRGVDGLGETKIGTNEKTGKQYLVFEEKGKISQVSDLLTIEDVYGNMQNTDPSMYGYKIYFEKLIREAQTVCIQATEGGAKIKGAKIMTLREAIDNYCKEPIEADKILKEASIMVENNDKQAMSIAIENILELFDKINKLSIEGIEIIDKLIEERKKEKNKRNKKTEYELSNASNKIRHQIDSMLTGNIKVMVEGHGSANKFLLNKSLNSRTDHLDQDEKLARVVERLVFYYQGIKFAAEDLSKSFQSIKSKI